MAEPVGVLGQIVAAKRAELAERLSGVTLDALRAMAVPTRLSLAAAVQQPGARFILEIKRASPSAGTIANCDSGEIARHYAGVADALSVLTDSAFFGGSLSDVAAARREFGGPILAKDFFVDLRQVAEARLAGADAILVMLSVLDDLEARAMIAEARRLGMDALVEVHDELEMGRAGALGAQLIGINNRDLRNLSIDLAVTERLAPLAAGRTLISESGIASRGDVDRLAGLVDGFLVGSALMKADSPAEAARALVHGRVKLCGLNRVEDLSAARPAAFAGLVFVPETPRHLTLAQAELLAARARCSGVAPVGVFRAAPAETVADTAQALRLRAVQLHGGEGPDDIADLRRRLPDDTEIWSAVDGSQPCRTARPADRLLFDNGNGGTGQTFDWCQLPGHPELAKALIAGGIGPHNVRAAAALGAYAIDIGSAVDEAPGTKSAAKIGALFEALRPRGREAIRQCA